MYILCRDCKVFFKGKLVIQRIYLYDKYESALNRVKPNRIKVRFFDFGDRRLEKQMYCDKFENQYGSIKPMLLIYKNKSTYDTRHFKGVFENGKE